MKDEDPQVEVKVEMIQIRKAHPIMRLINKLDLQKTYLSIQKLKLSQTTKAITLEAPAQIQKLKVRLPRQGFLGARAVGHSRIPVLQDRPQKATKCQFVKTEKLQRCNT